ncbi:MAG: D-alanyl-D-alanine carboxypeptidase, partial [Clostridia bacterium]|nr:D-alanyl-D-alanine carboxypeptidase [Clostridia bacterium]
MKNHHTKANKRLTARLAAGLLCLLLLIPILALPSTAAEDSQPDVERCSAAVLYNFENDQTVYEYKSQDRAFPGSSVKLMTALVAFDAFGDNLGTPITVTAAMLAEVTGNSIDFYEGEIVTAEEMLN